MNKNKLKLNGEKTELFLIRAKVTIKKFSIRSTEICSNTIQAPNLSENLGKSVQISYDRRSCYAHLCLIRSIQTFIKKCSKNNNSSFDNF